MLQYIIVSIVCVLSLAYAGWRIYKALRHADDACGGCEGCVFKGKNCQETTYYKQNCGSSRNKVN